MSNLSRADRLSGLVNGSGQFILWKEFIKHDFEVSSVSSYFSMSESSIEFLFVEMLANLGPANLLSAFL